MRAALLRNLDIGSLSFRFLVPIEAAAAKALSSDTHIRKVDGHAHGGVLIRLVPGVARPDLRPTVRAQIRRNISVDKLMPVAMEVHNGTRIDRPYGVTAHIGSA